MSRALNEALARWLAAGGTQIGQITIAARDEVFLLRHVNDAARTDLEFYSAATAARALANLDDAGSFRPLKTAPNLRRGWQLQLAGLAELRCALDYFYPAMLGVLLSHERGELQPVALRETLGRQTGMYRITQKITDPQADAMLGETCRSDRACLKTILWQIAPDVPITALPPEKFDPAAKQLPTAAQSLPLLCHEVCNLVVARAREIVKAASAPSP